MFSNHDTIKKDPGLARYIKKVARWTICGIGVTGLSAMASRHYILTDGKTDGAFVGKLMLVGAVGAIGSAVAICWSKPQILATTCGYDDKNSLNRKLAAGIQFVSQGIVLDPAFVLYPTLVVPSAACAGSVMAGMIGYALDSENGKLSKWGDNLSTGLWCLIGGSLLASYFGQDTQLGQHLDLMESIGGIGLFAAYVGYDLAEAVEEYQRGEPDALQRGVNMYLDFMNMFVRFMDLMSKNKKKN